jgi:hypothetical protein
VPARICLDRGSLDTGADTEEDGEAEADKDEDKDVASQQVSHHALDHGVGLLGAVVAPLGVLLLVADLDVEA